MLRAPRASPRASARVIVAPALAPGDLVGVVAPGSTVDRDAVRSGAAVLEGMGLRVRLGRSLFARHGTFAGDDRARAADLAAMLADEEVRAVHFARGGWGAYASWGGRLALAAHAPEEALIAARPLRSSRRRWTDQGYDVYGPRDGDRTRAGVDRPLLEARDAVRASRSRWHSTRGTFCGGRAAGGRRGLPHAIRAPRGNAFRAALRGRIPILGESPSRRRT
jgi:hypothetical protein